MQQVLDWLIGQSRGNRIKLAAAVGALAAIVAFLLLSNDNQVDGPSRALATATSQSTGQTEFTVGGNNSAGTVFVHVVGAVGQPGIYELEFGSRVADAIQAAGGLTAEAFDASVNLARVLSDGEQVRVLSADQIADSEQSSVISLNQANARQLETLPGVGPALAGRIIEWRERNGSFSTIEQLLEVSGIGPKLFENLREFVTL
jgi:competence protein ComEA